MATGTSSSTTFYVANVGYTPLIFSASPGVSKHTGNTADFTIDQTSLPTTILPGASAPFTITFSPLSAGTKTLALRIYTWDSDEYNYPLTVTGNASVAGGSSARSSGNFKDNYHAGSPLVTEENSPSVKVFPNPSKSGFTVYVSADQNQETVRLRIFNTMGTVFSSDELATNTHYTKGEDWVPGIYFMEVIGRTREVIKVMKE